MTVSTRTGFGQGQGNAVANRRPIKVPVIVNGRGMILPSISHSAAAVKKLNKIA